MSYTLFNIHGAYLAMAHPCQVSARVKGSMQHASLTDVQLVSFPASTNLQRLQRQ